MSGVLLRPAHTSQASSGSACLLLSMLIPTATVTLTPLYSKRLSDVPLAQALAMPGQWAGGSGMRSSSSYSQGAASGPQPQVVHGPGMYACTLTHSTIIIIAVGTILLWLSKHAGGSACQCLLDCAKHPGAIKNWTWLVL